MATSGTTTFNQNALQIISRAARQIGALEAGETPDGFMYADFLAGLNGKVKEWDAMGIHLWTESEAILYLQPGQIQYLLGPGSPDHATQIGNSAPGQTALLANAATGATSVQLVSTAGIVPGINLGVVLDNGAIYWATTAQGSFSSDFSSDFDTGASGTPQTPPTGDFSADFSQDFAGGQVPGVPLPGQVFFATGQALPSSASAGNFVFYYLTPVLRPLRIVNCRRFNIPSAIETPMNPMMARFDYRELPNKTDGGTITRAFYDPQLGLGSLWLWPAPTSWADAVKFTWYRQIQDFNNPTDTPDLPQEWLTALSFELAEDMMLEFDVPRARAELISAKAAKAMDRVTGFDREPESVYFGVDFSQSGY